MRPREYNCHTHPTFTPSHHSLSLFLEVVDRKEVTGFRRRTEDARVILRKGIKRFPGVSWFASGTHRRVEELLGKTG